MWVLFWMVGNKIIIKVIVYKRLMIKITSFGFIPKGVQERKKGEIFISNVGE